MPEPSKFWDKIAERYAKQPIEDEEAYQHKLKVTRELLRPEMNVLEFGCGTGGTAILHSPHVKHIHAIDISSKMLEFADANLKENGISNVTFECASIESFEAPDQEFDVVLGLSILHLLEDKQAAISKVNKLLKPGGVFISSTTCAGDTMKFLKFIVPVGRLLGLLPLLKIFTVKDLENSITDAGFEIEYQWQPAKGKAVFIVARKAEA